jgi:hypothetical protein
MNFITDTLPTSSDLSRARVLNPRNNKWVPIRRAHHIEGLDSTEVITRQHLVGGHIITNEQLMYMQILAY